MSLRLSLAATRAYDALKTRPGASPRESDARDTDLLASVSDRIKELSSSYRINGQIGPGGALYVFWTELDREIRAGAFDDLIDRL